jgi:ligand-binding SRPBCC domain-containing protein
MASQHFFEATENGTKMTDVVHYALPFKKKTAQYLTTNDINFL